MQTQLYRYVSVLVAVAVFVGAGAGAVIDVFGVVTGTTDVDGPQFYAGEDGTLLINTAPETASAYTLDGDGVAFRSQQFTTDMLSEPDFYPITADVTVEARLNTSTAEPLQLTFGFYNDTRAYTLCEESVTVQGSQYTTYSGACNATVQPENVDYFYYRFTEQTAAENVSYRIRADGTTRTEVTAQ